MNIVMHPYVLLLSYAYAAGSIGYHALSRLERPYLSSIKTEQVAQASFREALKDKTNCSSYLKKIYHYSIECALSIPMARLVLYFALFHFSPTANLDRLWLNQDLEPLVERLEIQATSTEGVTWTPKLQTTPLAPLSNIPSLSPYAVDLTREVSLKKLPPCIGRDQEIAQIAEAFTSLTPRYPVLLGEEGIGKKSVARRMAQKIAEGKDVPPVLKGKRVLYLHSTSLIRGSGRYSNHAEDMIKTLIQEAQNHKDGILLVLDGLDDYVKNDTISNNTLQNLALSMVKEKFPCVILATPEEYKQLLSKSHSQFSSLLTPIKLESPPLDTMRSFLRQRSAELELHHGVVVDDEAITHALLTTQNDARPLEKAFELLDQEMCKVAVQQRDSQDRKRATLLKVLGQMESQVEDGEKKKFLIAKIKEVRDQFSAKVVIPKPKMRELKLTTTVNRAPIFNEQWARRDIQGLICNLEEEMNRPGGITWTLPAAQQPPSSSAQRLPSLALYARDLTEEAAQGKARPFCGRDREINDIAIVLGRSQKSNPLLIGPPGVGKTTIAQGIAKKIAEDSSDLPAIYRGKKIFLLQWDRLMAGTMAYGEDTLEKRMLSVIHEAKGNKDVILFIDEIHLFLGSNTISNLLKPELVDGSLCCIGATTNWDYERLIQLDPALKRRFPQVPVGEPSKGELAVLLGKIGSYLEVHHGILISDEAISEVITLGERYLKSQCFPDKGIDLLDQAASALPPCDNKENQCKILLRLLLQMRNVVTGEQHLAFIDKKIQDTKQGFSRRTLRAEHIRSVMAGIVNLPLERVGESEIELLNSLESRLGERIIGQKPAIRALCQGVRRSRLRLGNQDRPAGVLLFLGSSGVGKTASARALCNVLYGSDDVAMLRLDMSEFKEEHSISKLIGSPPGYVGSRQGGILTNWLKDNPYSLVLLDEIEKAHPRIFELFLQVFDAGRITDGRGETVRCLETTFILTSNIGSKAILESHGSISSAEMDLLLKEKFTPEFLNRIQVKVVFTPLTLDEINRIASLQLRSLKDRVEKNTTCSNLELEWNDGLIQFLSENGYNPQYGARELERCITENLENPIADLIAIGKIREGAHLHFTAWNDTVQLTITHSDDTQSRYAMINGFIEQCPDLT